MYLLVGSSSIVWGETFEEGVYVCARAIGEISVSMIQLAALEL